MYTLPVNRWTIGAFVAFLLTFGNDLVEPLLKVVGILSASHVPAM